MKALISAAVISVALIGTATTSSFAAEVKGNVKTNVAQLVLFYKRTPASRTRTKQQLVRSLVKALASAATLSRM